MGDKNRKQGSINHKKAQQDLGRGNKGNNRQVNYEHVHSPMAIQGRTKIKTKSHVTTACDLNHIYEI